jgi:thioredoxin reductase
MKLDVAIIGGGISGLSAALFTGHADLRTVVFDTDSSQAHNISSLHNALGVSGLSGTELLEQYREKVKTYAELKNAKVEGLKKEGTTFTFQADGEIYEADRVIVATNLETELLESLGLKIGVNENIKSGKIKKVVGVNWEGTTKIPNLYIAGLLADIPSQIMIAAGQGAAVGVRVVQDATGEKYMWHDK